MNIVGLAPQLIISALAALVGLVLVWRGVYRSRFGTAPHCRKCGYNLSGSPELKCPECGRVNGPPRGPILGERRVARQRVWFGAVFFVIGTSLLFRFAIPIVKAVKWYQYAPLAWVIDDLDSGNGDRVRRAFDEVGRRYGMGRLSRDEIRDIADVCLREEALPNLRSTSSILIQLASNFFENNALSLQQRQVFLQNLITYELVTRKDVVAGKSFGARMQYDPRGPMRAYHATFKVLRWRVNGEDQPIEPIIWGPHPLAVRGHLATVGVKCQSPGSAKIEADIETTITFGPPVALPLFYDDSVNSTAVKVCNVLESEPENYVRLVRNADLDSDVARSLRVLEAYVLPADEDRLCQGLSLVTVQMFPWLNQELFFHATIFSSKGTVGVSPAKFTARSSALVGIPFGLDQRGPLTLVLRADPEAAAVSVDTESIWGGCLVFEGILVNDTPLQGRSKSNYEGWVADLEECDVLESNMKAGAGRNQR